MIDVAPASADQGERLSIGGVIAETLRGFGRAPVIFLAVGVVGQLPTGIQLVVAGEHAGPGHTTWDSIVFVLETFISALTDTLVIVIYMRRADGLQGGLGEALRAGVRRYLPMLGTTLLTLLAFFGGLILLVVPALFSMTLFEMAGPVCALESSGPIASLKRSAELSRGLRWRVLGISLILFVPTIAFVLLVTFAWSGSDLALDWLNLGFFVVWQPMATIASAATYRAIRRMREYVGVAKVFD